MDNYLKICNLSHGCDGLGIFRFVYFSFYLFLSPTPFYYVVRSHAFICPFHYFVASHSAAVITVPFYVKQCRSFNLQVFHFQLTSNSIGSENFLIIKLQSECAFISRCIVTVSLSLFLSPSVYLLIHFFFVVDFKLIFSQALSDIK